jgi:hypothetical protein
MRISQKFVESIVSEIVKELLQKKMIEVSDYTVLQEKLVSVVIDDLMVEDKLDDEVRKIMEQHADVIRSSNVEYHEMFKTIKKKLVKERKIIL